MTPSSPPHPRILIIRPSALGDVCRSVPVLASLRRAYPQAKIDWLVQDAFAPAIAAHPALSEVVPFPRKELARWYAPSTTPAVRKFLAGLADHKYDIAIDCQGLLRSGLFALATRAHRRIGFDNAQELGWLGLTERIHAPRDLHTVDRMLLLAEAAGGSSSTTDDDARLYCAAADRAWAESQQSLAGGRFAVIAPTTRWPGKRWDGSRFATLAEIMLREGMFGIDKIALVGAASEREQCPELLALAARDPRIVDLIGSTTVGQMMALIERSSVLVGCDSAPVHMAVGFGKPMAALYGPTRVERVGPYRHSAHVVQRLIPGDVLNHKDEQAGRKLMNRITVDDVLDCLRVQASRTEPAAPARA